MTSIVFIAVQFVGTVNDVPDTMNPRQRPSLIAVKVTLLPVPQTSADAVFGIEYESTEEMLSTSTCMIEMNLRPIVLDEFPRRKHCLQKAVETRVR